jgi:phosphoribosylaminoimidazole-succinocarboxamide synthase
LDQVYSIRRRGPVPAPGAGEVRARINARLSEVLRAAGVRTSTIASRPPYVLMRRHRVAEHIEVVVKAAVRGSPRHRYPGLCTEPTRSGARLGDNARHAPYVRFDWRVPSPGEDQMMPRALADHFIDADAAERTALRAFHALREHLRRVGLDLLDGCFFLDEAGEVVCGEVSPDNLASIEYTGRDPAVQEAFRRRGKAEIVRTWRAIDALLAGSAAGESAP